MTSHSIFRYPELSKSLREIEYRFKARRIAVFLHRHADLDSFCSSFVLSSQLKRRGVDAVLVAQDDMNAPSKAYAARLKLSVLLPQQVDWAGIEGLIILDGRSLEMFPALKLEYVRQKPLLLVVDHHRGENELHPLFLIQDEHARATAEILALGLEHLEPTEAEALAVAIISDTAHFRTATQHTFTALSRCLNIAGLEYEQALALAFPEKSPEDKEVILRAFTTLTIHRISGFVVVIAETKKNESDVSSALAEVADVSFAVRWDSELGKTRVSSRARQHVPIRLHELMRVCGEKTGGSGGGHEKAAGAFLGCNLEEAKRVLLEETKRQLAELV